LAFIPSVKRTSYEKWKLYAWFINNER
jgi:hypothetical protein